MSDARLRMAASQCGADTTSFESVEFPFGHAALQGSIGWVYVTEQHARALSPALLWAGKNEIISLNVLTETDADVLARRAQLFDSDISIWGVANGRVTRAAASGPLPSVKVRDTHEQFALMIETSGADVVREHGLLTGEVLGLEVCRVVNDDAGDGARLEIGVGAHDRETFQLVHGRDATVESLARVAGIVRDHRNEGSVPHPLNRLAAERLLRHRIVASPELIGAAHLQPVEPPVRRMNVKDEMPCVALGTLANGTPVVVVCTASIDVDVVAFGADARLRAAPDAELFIATHANNVTPSLHKLAQSLRNPARFVEVSPVRR